MRAPTRTVTSVAEPNRPSTSNSSAKGWVMRQESTVTTWWERAARNPARPWVTAARTVVR